MCKPTERMEREPVLASGDTPSAAPKTMWQKLRHDVLRTKLRHEFNRPYATNEDFKRMLPERQRVIVIGCTGAGKSTLVNALGGCKKVWVEEGGQDGTFEWDTKKAPKPMFASGFGASSYTQNTSFANLHYLGKKEKPLIVVDTPGHDDPKGANIDEAHARQKLQEQAADLHAKLKGMGHLNTILIMHNDVHSNRLNPATYELLRKVDEMFKDNDQNVWEHVIVAYTKCDADSRGWKDNLSAKKIQMQESLRQTFPRIGNLDVPILTLSGVSVDGAGNTKLNRDFGELWDCIDSAPALGTRHISKFDGLDVRIGRLVEGRDRAIRVAEARQEFPHVSGNVLMLIVTLIVRSVLLPFLDLPGVLDEAALFGLLAYRTGLYKVLDWAVVLWDDVLLQKVKCYAGVSDSTLGYFKLIRLEKAGKDGSRDDEPRDGALEKAKLD